MNLNSYTSSAMELGTAVLSLYDRIVDPNLSIHRLSVTFNNVIDESRAVTYVQYDLFITPEEIDEKERILKRDRKLQQAILDIQKKYGKNAILKGISLEEGATAIERNSQIGGHRA